MKDARVGANRGDRFRGNWRSIRCYYYVATYSIKDIECDEYNIGV